MSLIEEVTALAERAEAARDEDLSAALDKLQGAIETVGRSWSGSNLGYQATVYYQDFGFPPAGNRFNREWGLSGVGIFNTTGPGWERRSDKEVEGHISALSGVDDLAALRERTLRIERELVDVRDGLDSVVTAALADWPEDTYLQRQAAEARAVEAVPAARARQAFALVGQAMSRDPLWDGTWQLAAHQEVAGQVASMQSVTEGLDRLARLGRQVASHLRRASSPLRAGKPEGEPVGAGRVFIGHGRSNEWLKLRIFIAERLGLPADEFNRVPVAGYSTSERLQAMLDEAAFAFLVLTAEDELKDGQVAARQNVVHEVGLFQGRLGLRRAIVVLEDGCEEFSNIHGLNQIRFPPGNIAAAFEEVRATLEREGLLISVAPSRPGHATG